MHGFRLLIQYDENRVDQCNIRKSQSSIYNVSVIPG